MEVTIGQCLGQGYKLKASLAFSLPHFASSTPCGPNDIAIINYGRLNALLYYNVYNIIII